jgi:hypothetical protein
MTLIPDDKIREMQERVEKATPGQWDVDVRCDGSNVDMFPEDNEDYVLAEFNGCVDPNDGYNNAVFAAHARADIPKLLAERKELLSERDRLAGIVEKLAKQTNANLADGSSDACCLCGYNLEYAESRSIEVHAADCPYRRAVEWQEEQREEESLSEAKDIEAVMFQAFDKLCKEWWRQLPAAPVEGK